MSITSIISFPNNHDHCAPTRSRHAPAVVEVKAGGSGINNETTADILGEHDGVAQNVTNGGVEVPSWELCQVGMGVEAADYIPCLDNMKAIKALKSLRHMEHWERHCPMPRPRCLVPLPHGTGVPSCGRTTVTR
jgi:hypothetical protein